MSEWDELLLGAIGSTQADTKAASSDLNAIVTEVADSVAKMSGGRITLGLRDRQVMSQGGGYQIPSFETGTFAITGYPIVGEYQVTEGKQPGKAAVKRYKSYSASSALLIKDGTPRFHICDFVITSHGYPILYILASMVPHALNDRTQLQDFFRKLLSNRDSVLVVSLLLLMREEERA